MANVGLGVANPIYIDTAATVHTGWVTIQTIVYGTPNAGAATSAGNGFVLTDTAGNTILSYDAQAGGLQLVVPFPYGLKVNGIICTALDSGVIHIYTVNV